MRPALYGTEHHVKPVKISCTTRSASKHEPSRRYRFIVNDRFCYRNLLDRALTIECNAQAKVTTVKGLGRSFDWETFFGSSQ